MHSKDSISKFSLLTVLSDILKCIKIESKSSLLFNKGKKF